MNATEQSHPSSQLTRTKWRTEDNVLPCVGAVRLEAHSEEGEVEAWLGGVGGD